MTFCPCIIENMPAAEYHSMREWTGSSVLRKLASSSPLHAKHYENTPIKGAALDLGTAFHAAMLQPEEEIYVIAPECDRRTKEGKALWAEFQADHKGLLIIDYEMGESLNGMIAAAQADWRWTQALKKTKREVSVFGDFGGQIKSRMDSWKEDLIIDIKTSSEPVDAGSFSRSMDKFGYAQQACHYRECLKSSLRLQNKLVCDNYSFIFLCVETKAPYGTAAYRLDDLDMDLHMSNLANMNKWWHECRASNFFPGYPQENIMELRLPGYALNKLTLQNGGPL